jgi:hypothetical protein
MSNAIEIAPGDKVAIVSAASGDERTGQVVRIFNDGKSMLVRGTWYTAYNAKPETIIFTLRKCGTWVIKGKQTKTWNREYLQITASGL